MKTEAKLLAKMVTDLRKQLALQNSRMAKELEAPGLFESGSEDLAEYCRIEALEVCCKKHLGPKISSLTAQSQTTAQLALKRAQGN